MDDIWGELSLYILSKHVTAVLLLNFLEISLSAYLIKHLRYILIFP